MSIAFRKIFVCFIAVFALSAVAATAASAHEWTANKKAITVAKEVSSSGGVFVLKTAKEEITCKKVTDKGTVGPGATDKATEIKFAECTAGTKGCEVRNKGGTFGTVVVSEIPTKLEEVEVEVEGKKVKKLVDTFEQKTVENEKKEKVKEFVTLEFKGATCAGEFFTETKVKGDVAAETKNEANGEVKLTFPSKPLPVAAELNAFALPATLSGTDNEKLVNGEVLEAV